MEGPGHQQRALFLGPQWISQQPPSKTETCQPCFDVQAREGSRHLKHPQSRSSVPVRVAVSPQPLPLRPSRCLPESPVIPVPQAGSIDPPCGVPPPQFLHSAAVQTMLLPPLVCFCPWEFNTGPSGEVPASGIGGLAVEPGYV